MKIELINCPYCEAAQKVFHINYTFIKLLKEISPTNKQIFILNNYTDPNKFIKNFNCKNCNEKLMVYYNIETYQYFIRAEKLFELEEKIKKIRIKIKKIRKKIIVTYNQEIIELLKSEIDKEEQSLNHLLAQESQSSSLQTFKLDRVVNS